NWASSWRWRCTWHWGCASLPSNSCRCASAPGSRFRFVSPPALPLASRSCSMWSDVFASLSLSTLAVLWLGAILGGIASGAAGFAFGIVGSSIWLHAIEPVQTTFLVAAGGLAIQAGTIWPLRHSLDRRRLGPLLLAGVI